MQERTKEFMMDSLKGRLWVMHVVLAASNLIAGGLSLFLVYFLTSSLLVSAVCAGIAMTIATMIFAGWNSRSFIDPVTKVALLAQSIERTPGMTLPKTTGASETDDILHTLGRTSQQMTNFIAIMDEVTAGNTAAALNPLEHSDRISSSFQKLISKITDSIDAKHELAQLQNSVSQLSTDVNSLQRGDLTTARNENELTRPIFNVVRSMADRHTKVTNNLGHNISELRMAVADGVNLVRKAIEDDESRNKKFKLLVAAVTDANKLSNKTSREMSSALSSVSELLAEINKGSISPAENSRSLTAIRKQFETALHRLKNVGEQSLAITQVAKAVQDLARRSSMIALNSSIQFANGTSSADASLTQEITSMSERAEKTNKSIAEIGDSVIRDVNEAQASLHWLNAELVKISDRTFKDEDAMLKITTVLKQLSDLPAKIDLKTIEQSVELERLVQLLEDYTLRSDNVTAELRACEGTFQRLVEPIDALYELSAGRSVQRPAVAALPQTDLSRVVEDRVAVPAGLVSEEVTGE